MEKEKKCCECKHMVKIISDYCYRTIYGYTCYEERNNLVNDNYFHCGLEGKYFERKKKEE